MGGRLLKRLEESVESGCREHVYLVDDEHRVVPDLRNDAHLFDQRADVLNRVVGGGVEFVNVHRAALVEAAARLAVVAGFRPLGVQAVDRLGKNAGTGGFPHSTRPAKEVGVGQLSALDRIAERGGDMLLADHRTEGCRTVFACANDKVTHHSTKIANNPRTAMTFRANFSSRVPRKRFVRLIASPLHGVAGGDKMTPHGIPA